MSEHVTELMKFDLEKREWSDIKVLSSESDQIVPLARTAMIFVHHYYRQQQDMIEMQNWPPVKAHLDESKVVEGLYIFGGQMSDGSASNELYILECGQIDLTWTLGSEVCKGQAPTARFDHSLTKVR